MSISLNCEINVTRSWINSTESVWSCAVISAVIFLINPCFNVAFWISVVTNFIAIEASISDKLIVGYYEQPISCLVGSWVNTVRDLCNESIRPSGVCFVPVRVVVSIAPWISHKEKLIGCAIISHCESWNNRVCMAHGNTTIISFLVISISSCTCTHQVVSSISGLH